MFGLDVFQYTKRIRECTKAGNMIGAMHLFQSMKLEGVRPDVVTYSTVMDGFSKAEDSGSVHLLFDEMIKSGVKPNHYTFNVAIRACAIDSNLTKAAHLFSSMQQKYGLKPNAWTYGSMLHLCAVAGQLPLAKKCFDRLEKEGIPMNVVTCNCLIDAYAEATVKLKGQLHLNECLSLVEKMKSRGIQEDVRTFASLIKLCVRAKLTKEAFEVVERMQKRGMLPSVYIYNMLLDSITKDDSISKSEATSRMNWILDETEKKKTNLSLETYTTLFTLCRKLEDRDLADRFLAKLKASGLKRSAINYSSIIKCYEELGDPSDKETYLKTCFDLAEEMKAAGFPLDIDVYASLIAACGRSKNVRRAYDLWKEAYERVKMNAIVCGALIEVFLQADRIKDAKALLKRMESTGVVRNSVICKVFMKYFATKQQKEEAKQFLREMQDLKIGRSEAVCAIVKSLGLS